MLTKNSVFGNLFSDNNIITVRLYVFGNAVLANLVQANTDGQYDALIAALTAALDAMGKELGSVDTSINEQVTSTQDVDSFIAGFANYMSEEEPFIAKALGGRQSAGYYAFYPKKISEYGAATKTTMPVLTVRVGTAAAKYAKDLGTDLSTTLQGFDKGYKTVLAAQKDQISAVKQDRTSRDEVSMKLQLILTSTVYSIGAMYPDDVDKCGNLFPFTMLYAQTKKKYYNKSGPLQPGEVVTLLNRTLIKSNTIEIENTGDNSSQIVWLATLPTDAPPEDALEIKPGEGKKLDLSGLDLNNTYLMIKNVSGVNAGTYKVTFSGFKKAIESTKNTADVSNGE